MKALLCAGFGLMAGGLLAAELTVGEGGLTPQGALEAIRAAKAAGSTEAWTVRVKPGVHTLAQTLAFKPEDSGAPGAPVVWEGEGAASVISGGAAITGWRETAEGVWEADAPKDAAGHPIYFESLYVNGRRAPRARVPDEGFFKPGKVSEAAMTDAVTRAVTYVDSLAVTNAAAAAALAGVPQAELAYGQLVMHVKWSFSRFVLRGYDAAAKTLTAVSRRPWDRWGKWDDGFYYIENVRGAFDKPGEWFYDGAAGKVLYRPLPGERMRRGCPLAFWQRPARIVAPTAKLGRLVAFAGDCAKGRFVHDITFRNLTFAFSDGLDGSGSKGPTQFYPYQAACETDAAVTADGCRNIRWEGCAIAHTGNYGLWLREGCMSNAVERCVIEDVGAGGVRIGVTRDRMPLAARKVVRAYSPESTAFNTVDNCIIRNGGRFNAEGVGVFIANASDNAVTHNDISDLYYTGVSVGWVWGYAGSVAQRNTVAFNRIHKIGQAKLADMGGVYTLGASFGTRIANNFIWDVDSYSYGGWGLYTDEGSEDIVLENNLVCDTKDGSFNQHYGVNNTVRNNIFCFNREKCAVQTSRALVTGVHSTLNIERNIVVTRHSPVVGRGVRDVGGRWARNLWFDESGKADFGGMDFAAWQKTGKETEGAEADPKFADPAAWDFRLSPDSPALALGFQPFDVSQAGVYGPMKALVAGDSREGARTR